MNRTACPPDCACDCCTGVEQRTPLSVANAPGLPALSYRVGAYGDFFSSMVAHLATMEVAHDPAAAASSLGRVLLGRINPSADPSLTPLAALTTRALDDPTIAFLDAWAVALDVLTFYQERLANEGFLRTATELFSVRELARLVGYTPSPGVSASAYLAYTLEQGGPVTIPTGSRVTSTPGPGQLPQTFETSADLDADPRWNFPAPRQMRPQVLEPGQTTSGHRLFFEGLTTQLKPNDPLVLVFDAAHGEPFRVKKVTPDNPAQRTMVVLLDFDTVPVFIEAKTAIKVAVAAVTDAIAAYHAAEPAQIGATIRVAAAVHLAVDGVVNPPPLVTIQAEVLLAIKAVGDQIARVKDLQDDLVPLDSVAAALTQLDNALNALKALTGDKDVQEKAAKALNAFTAALSLSPEYQAAAIAIFTATDTLSQHVQAGGFAGKTLDDVLLELRLQLIQLRTTQAALPTQPQPPLGTRLDGLIARLESAEDRLLLWNVSVRMSAFKPSIPASPAAKAIAEILATWSEDGIRDLSPVNLANRLYQSINRLNEHIDDDRATIETVRKTAAGFLYSAILALLRQILNRFYYEQQAGIARDTRLAGSALASFGSLRGILNPTTGVDDRVDDLVALLDATIHNLDALKPVEPIDDLAKKLKLAVSAYKTARTIDLTEFTAEVLAALIQFGSDRSRFAKLLDDINNALAVYQQPAPATAALGGAVGIVPGVTVPIPTPLQVLKDAIETLQPRAQAFLWIKKQLEDLKTRANGATPDPDVRDFAKRFQDAVLKIGQAFADVTGKAGSLLDYLPALNSVADLLTKTQDLLLALRRDQRLAQAGKYPRVGPWLDELVEALEHFSSDFEMHAPPTPAEASTNLQQERSPNQAASPDTDSLPNLGSLSKPPAQTPASPYRLQRRLAPQAGDATNDPSAAFLDDLAPQLAVAFDPRLGDNLYAALANAVTRRNRRFQGVHVLRARSAPFGHNAPPRTLFGPGGGVSGTTEWPLAFERVTVRVLPVGGTTVAATRTAPSAGVAVEVRFEASGRQNLLATYTITAGTVGGGAGATSDIKVTWDAGSGTLRTSLPGTRLKQIDLAAQADPSQVTVTQTIEKTADAPLICVEGRDATRVGADGGYLAVGFNLQDKRILSVVSEVTAGLPTAHRNVLRLDTTNDRVTPGGYVIIQRAGDPVPVVARIEAVATVSPKDFGQTGTVTQLTLDKAWLNPNDTTLATLRDVTVYLQSEELVLSGEPFDADLGPISPDDPNGGLLELDAVVPGLKPGRWFIVAGERTDVPGVSGVQAAELVMLAAATQVVDAAGGDGQGLPHTLLRLAAPLAYAYQRATATIWGNVVKATQGETRNEILGSGNPAVADQSFNLKQAPLTFLPAPVPSGVAAALQVRVNGLLWHPTEEPLAAGPTDRVYVLELGEKGAAVVFGDGTNGARLPAGSDNVRALYRIGLGSGGNVEAGKINQLATRPLGVKAVVNPLAAAGGADPERAASARRNAPVGVTAMGRLVSVEDYADFARAFVGVEKAYATRVSDGFVTRLHLTLAGQDGDALDPRSDLYRNLVLALRRFGDPGLSFAIAARRMRFIVFAASLRIDPDYQVEEVVPRATALLNAAYHFDLQEFATDVVLSNIVALLQSVAGVTAVRTDGFGLVDERDATVDEDPPPTPLYQLAQQIKDVPQGKSVPPVLPVYGTRRGAKGIRAAEIAVLSPRVPQTLILNEWTT